MGKAAKYTRAFKPVRVAQCWKVFGDKGMALRVEILIKGFDRKAKEQLVDKPDGLDSMVNNELDVKVEIAAFDPKLIEDKILELGDDALKVQVDPFAC